MLIKNLNLQIMFNSNSNSKNHQTLTYSPHQSRANKNYEQSTTCFQISKGKSIEFKNQNRRYSQRCCHQQYSNQNLIFRPLINELPYHLYPGTQTQKMSKSREEIRQRLIEDGTKTFQQRLSNKIRLQNQEQQNCSFHPKISEFAHQLGRKQTDELIYQKLFNQGKQRQLERIQTEKMKEQQQKNEIKRLLNYKLQLKNKKVLNEQKHSLVPIQNRINQIIQSKIKERKLLQKQIQQENNMNFQPQISQTSQKIAQKRIDRQKLKIDVVGRLMEEYERIKKNRQHSLQIHKNKQQQQCTFNPEINRNYTFSRYSGQDKSIYFDKLQRSHRQCQDEQRHYSFIPKINYMSDLIVQHKRANQEMDSKLYRLSRRPIQDKKQEIEKIRLQVQANFTFKPKINDITYIMQAQPKSHRCEQPPPQIFSFQPTINEKSKLIRAQSSERAKMRAKKKILEYKLQSEYQELKQCSFHPKINNRRHQDERRLTNVEGVQKFMSLKQKAREKAALQKQREKHLFHLQIKYDERRDFKQQY